MKKIKSKQFRDFPKDYESLCRDLLLPRPIHDKVEYQNTVEVTDAMALWHDDFTPDQADYFKLLCSQIEEYDTANVSWPELTDTEIISHLLKENNLKPSDLSTILGGSRNLGGMILRGDRNLTAKHIQTLCRRFNVSADLFLKRA